MPTLDHPALAFDLNQVLSLLRDKDVSPKFYCINSLGNGECVGISNTNGRWETYYSERGQRTSVVPYADEEKACAAFLTQLEQHLVDYGLKVDLTSRL